MFYILVNTYISLESFHVLLSHVNDDILLLHLQVNSIYVMFVPFELFHNSMLNTSCKQIIIINMSEIHSFEQMDLGDQYSYATLSCQGYESGTLIVGSFASP